MRRTHVEKHLPGFQWPLVHSSQLPAPSFQLLINRADQRLPLVDRVVLSKRMADEFLIKKDALQVLMAFEADPEHVPDLAFEPISARPQRCQGIDLCIA